MNIVDARAQWLDHGLSDLDYIRHLEAELKEPKTCDGCIHIERFSDNFGKYYMCQIPMKNCSRRLVDHYEPKKQQC